MFQKVKYNGDLWVVKLTFIQLESLINFNPDYEILITNLSTGSMLNVRVGDVKKI